MIMYGIRHKETKKMLFVDYEGTQDADDCVETSFRFEEIYGTILWLVDNKETATKALNENTEWYNASYSSPQHNSIEMSQYEVVEVIIKHQNDTSIKRQIKFMNSDQKKKPVKVVRHKRKRSVVIQHRRAKPRRRG